MKKLSPIHIRIWDEPGNLLFPLAGILACASVVHWLVVAFSPDTTHRHVYHMIASVQAFLTCLLAAFSFIWLQKAEDNHGHIKHTLRCILAVLATVGTAVTAWLRYAVPREIMLAVSEISWLILALIIAYSVLPRIHHLRKTKRWPDSFIWLPAALIFGIAGAVLVSTYSSVLVVTGNKIWWLVFLGRGYLLQCMFLSVIIAVAPVILPQILKPGGTKINRMPMGKPFHIICALILVLSIILELWVSYFAGMFVRALITYVTIVHTSRLWTLPRRNSPLSWCIWGSAWLLPCGYAVAALSPACRLVGLHIVFIGGFSLGSLSYALYRLIDGRDDLRGTIDRGLTVGSFSGFLVLALVLRSFSAATLEARIFSWGHSTLAYILGVLVWLYLVAKALYMRNTQRKPTPG
jgi:hypothetical protein